MEREEKTQTEGNTLVLEQNAFCLEASTDSKHQDKSLPNKNMNYTLLFLRGSCGTIVRMKLVLTTTLRTHASH